MLPTELMKVFFGVKKPLHFLTCIKSMEQRNIQKVFRRLKIHLETFEKVY